MDSLHKMLSSIRTETKAKTHLSVFREFLAHLDQVQRQAPVQRPRSKPRRRVAKRAK
ncbi:MAG: hypothetical protein HXX15_13160 [Rhodopseudomonas sp.]|uniref:hypothetical protein n=1 Tax=Rhodopseudomonas sp. TaxID=1078 RepID=UPI00180048BC|nr:hypothetical protein [Rhodopseudomonas sp.]NVN87023.1 hypothetical protein [Rhodopseudomonas sp.]